MEVVGSFSCHTGSVRWGRTSEPCCLNRPWVLCRSEGLRAISLHTEKCHHGQRGRAQASGRFPQRNCTEAQRLLGCFPQHSGGRRSNWASSAAGGHTTDQSGTCRKGCGLWGKAGVCGIIKFCLLLVVDLYCVRQNLLRFVSQWGNILGYFVLAWRIIMYIKARGQIDQNRFRRSYVHRSVVQGQPLDFFPFSHPLL